MNTGFVPHTPEEIEAMLAFLGMGSVDELFAAIPESIRFSGKLAMEDGLGEADVLARLEGLAARNRQERDLICFAGAGAYDHEIPAAVRALASRSEFVTAYTPYQPEVSQGVLQALFEFQTLVARLTALPVSNASLYDGASALVEALNLAGAATRRSRMWVSQGVHPNWRAVARTFACGTGHRIEEIPLVQGETRWPSPEGVEAPAAVVLAYPNFLGCLEEVERARRLADETGALLVVATDPVSTGILRRPGEWGADVAVGEGHAFGTPLSFGGPYLGLFSCSLAQVRRLPGRLVGETVDSAGRRAYVTTLRAREQDIRREKASSNVCTNQTLMAITAAIHLSWLGTGGLSELALRCARGTRYLREKLLSLDGIEAATSMPTFREFALRTPVAPELLVERLADEGFLAGVPLGAAGCGSEYGDGLLLAVTEKRTREEIDAFADVFAKAVR